MSEPTSIFDPRVRGAAISILMLVGLSAFEGLAVAAALPQLAADLGQVEMLPWVITGYLLTSGVATVAGGALIDRLGVAALFRMSVITFIVGGVLSGLSPNMTTLVLARAIQGAGAGVINAVGLTSVGLVFPRALVGRAFAANTNVWGVMSVAGPGIASLLLAFASWRWIFYLNLPLGGLALWAGWSAMPGPTQEDGDKAVALRPVELLLLGILTFFVLFAVDAMDWRSVPAALAALATAWFTLWRSRGNPNALLAPRHAVDTPLGPLAWGISLLLIGSIGVQSFVPLFVRGGRGAGTALTAWSMVFFVVGWTVGANVGSRIMQRVQPLYVTLTGGVLVTTSLMVVCALVLNDAPLWLVFPTMFVAGTGTGSATNSALTVLRDLVEDAELGRAVAAHQFMRNLGMAVGNALVGAVLLTVVGMQTGDVDRIRSLLREGSEAVATDPNTAAAIAQGFGTAAGVCALVSLVALLPLAKVWTYVQQRA